MIQTVVRKGKVLAEQIPAPLMGEFDVKIRVMSSTISVGTEVNNVKTSGKSLLQRAKDKPEKVKKVLKDVVRKGIMGTVEMIKSEMNIGTPTGYSLSGIVIATGRNVQNFKTGDRVTAVGGQANHSAIVSVPANLVRHIPPGLSFDSASTVAIGAIAMQGVRRANLQLGEFCAVYGTGVIGLITVWLLKYSGVRVAAIDLDEERLQIAQELGAEIIVKPAEDKNSKIDNWTGGYGVDAVIFTAATSSSEPLSESFQMCKQKGKVVLVGVSGMEFKRKDIYKKELDFMMSTSYGPGRYDKIYEEQNIDYPYAYVRWTEGRNMDEYLRLLSQDDQFIQHLITHRISIDNVEKAFKIAQTKSQKSLLICLLYEKEVISNDGKIVLSSKSYTLSKEVINIGLIGAGSFAKGQHLPNMKKLKNKYKLEAIFSKTGLSAKNLGETFNANYITDNETVLFNDERINTILICSRHGSHGKYVIDALEAGKNVIVEKPLTTNPKELQAIKAFYDDSKERKPRLFVGYNRRHSKYLKEIVKHTDERINPLVIHYRMNAGYVPKDSWIHEDGGRIIGEACHVIDTINAITQSPVLTVSSETLSPKNDKLFRSDNKVVILKYADGSLATFSYFANGNKSLGKEYMEVHFDGKSIILDDYKQLSGFGIELKDLRSSYSDKGHKEFLVAITEMLKWPDETYKSYLDDILMTSKVSFLITED